MPSNEQRRATAKRKLERQLQRRAERARRRRIWMIAGGAALAVAVVAAGVVGVMMTTKHNDTKPAASSAQASSPPSAPSSAAPDAPTSASPLPPFVASGDVGANCQYPATQEPASRKVDPPRSGKVPTDEKTISVSMTTNQGNVGLLLDNAKAPCTVNSFASLAQKGYFDNTPCHRLTTSADLSVLQCGDPTGSGSGGPGYQFANEYPTDQYKPDDPALQQPVIYPRGTLAMANAGPGTNGSQFFMVYKDSRLPPNYTVFGTIDQTGLATLGTIAAAGVAGGGQDGKPATAVEITKVQLDL